MFRRIIQAHFTPSKFRLLAQKTRPRATKPIRTGDADRIAERVQNRSIPLFDIVLSPQGQSTLFIFKSQLMQVMMQADSHCHKAITHRSAKKVSISTEIATVRAHPNQVSRSREILVCYKSIPVLWTATTTCLPVEVFNVQIEQSESVQFAHQLDTADLLQRRMHGHPLHLAAFVSERHTMTAR